MSQTKARGRRALPIFSAAVCALGLVTLPSALEAAKPSTDLEIEPGPASITADERAIAADPANGVEHAVILLEETNRYEDAFTVSVTSYHLRAKILSNEGRPLANIEIPYVSNDGRLKRWWGRTILPDGTVHELKENELDHQSLIKTTRGEIRAMKGALRAVVPGCIIDYGYELMDTSIEHTSTVNLQREWMVREIRYRWRPATILPAAYRLRRTAGKNVKVTTASRGFLVVARDLPPVVHEPLMPPDQEVRASVVFYYLAQNADKDYWNMEAKRIERGVKARIGNLDRLRDALVVMKLTNDADLKTKVAAAYDWMAGNVKNRSLSSSEEEELEGLDEEASTTWNARSVLEERKGEGRGLDILFLGAVRALGAEANLVFVTNRTQQYWDEELFSTDQFATSVVAVHDPRDPPEQLVFADPGSGLPYGEVPWWMAGARGLMATKEGARSVVLRASGADRNLARANVKVAFSDDNATMTTRFTIVKSGQQGLSEKQYLRSLIGGDRAKRLELLCGGSGTTDVVHAASPDLDSASVELKIECDTEASGTDVDEDITTYRLGISGPWLEELADLTAPSRVHPVVFPYLETDLVEAQFDAPHGFEATVPPALIQTSVPYGDYELSVTKTENGYLVTRSLTWRALVVPASEYDSLRAFLAEVKKGDRTALDFRRTAGEK